MAASPQIVRIPLGDIDTSNRLRPIDEDQATLIAASFGARGQDAPITVRPAPKRARKPWVLVAGGHRCRAAAILEWSDIDAIVREMTADQARMAEIDENLYRADLSDLDRAVFLAEKKRLYEAMHPETRHGGDRRSDQVAIFGDKIALRFTSEVVERLGLSERSIQRILGRARLTPDIRARIAGTRLARVGAELDALVRLPPDQQSQVLDLMLSGREDAPRTVAAAAVVVAGKRKPPLSPEDVEFDRLASAWKRAGARARARFLDEVVRRDA